MTVFGAFEHGVMEWLYRWQTAVAAVLAAVGIKLQLAAQRKAAESRMAYAIQRDVRGIYKSILIFEAIGRAAGNDERGDAGRYTLMASGHFPQPRYLDRWESEFGTLSSIAEALHELMEGVGVLAARWKYIVESTTGPNADEEKTRNAARISAVDRARALRCRTNAEIILKWFHEWSDTRFLSPEIYREEIRPELEAIPGLVELFS